MGLASKLVQANQDAERERLNALNPAAAGAPTSLSAAYSARPAASQPSTNTRYGYGQQTVPPGYPSAGYRYAAPPDPVFVQGRPNPPSLPPQSLPPGLSNAPQGPGAGHPLLSPDQSYWALVAEEWNLFGAYRRDAIEFNEARRRRDEARLLKLEKANHQEKRKRRDQKIASRAIAEYRARYETGESPPLPEHRIRGNLGLYSQLIDKDDVDDGTVHAPLRSGKGKARADELYVDSISHIKSKSKSRSTRDPSEKELHPEEKALPEQLFEGWVTGSWGKLEQIPVSEAILATEARQDQKNGKLTNIYKRLQTVPSDIHGKLRSQCTSNATRDSAYIWTVVSVKTQREWTMKFFLFPKIKRRSYFFTLRGDLTDAAQSVRNKPAKTHEVVFPYSYRWSIDSSSLSSQSSHESDVPGKSLRVPAATVAEPSSTRDQEAKSTLEAETPDTRNPIIRLSD